MDRVARMLLDALCTAFDMEPQRVLVDLERRTNATALERFLRDDKLRRLFFTCTASQGDNASSVRASTSPPSATDTVVRFLAKEGAAPTWTYKFRTVLPLVKDVPFAGINRGSGSSATTPANGHSSQAVSEITMRGRQYSDNLKILQALLDELPACLVLCRTLEEFSAQLQTRIVRTLEIWAKVYKKNRHYTTQGRTANGSAQASVSADIVCLTDSLKLVHAITAFVSSASVQQLASSLKEMANRVLQSRHFASSSRVLHSVRGTALLGVVDRVLHRAGVLIDGAADRHASSLTLLEALIEQLHQVYGGYAQMPDASFAIVAALSERIEKLKLMHDVVAVGAASARIARAAGAHGKLSERCSTLQDAGAELLNVQYVLSTPFRPYRERVERHRSQATALFGELTQPDDSLVAPISSTFGADASTTLVLGDACMHSIARQLQEHLGALSRAFIARQTTFVSTYTLQLSQAAQYCKSQLAQLDQLQSCIQRLYGCAQSEMLVNQFVALRSAVVHCLQAYVRAWRSTATNIACTLQKRAPIQLVCGFPVLSLSRAEQAALEHLRFTDVHRTVAADPSYAVRLSQLQQALLGVNDCLHRALFGSANELYQSKLQEMLLAYLHAFLQHSTQEAWQSLVEPTATERCTLAESRLAIVDLLFTNLRQRVASALADVSAPFLARFKAQDPQPTLPDLVAALERWLLRCNADLSGIWMRAASAARVCCTSLSTTMLPGCEDESVIARLEATIASVVTDVHSDFAQAFATLVHQRLHHLSELVDGVGGPSVLTVQLVFRQGVLGIEPDTAAVLQHVDHILSLHRRTAIDFANAAQWPTCVASIDKAVMQTRKRIIGKCQETFAGVHRLLAPYQPYVPLLLLQSDVAVLEVLRQNTTVEQLQAVCSSLQAQVDIVARAMQSGDTPAEIRHEGLYIDCRHLQRDILNKLRSVQHGVQTNMLQILQHNVAHLADLLDKGEGMLLLDSPDTYDMLARQLRNIDRKLDAIQQVSPLVDAHPFLRVDKQTIQTLIDRRQALHDVMRRVGASASLAPALLSLPTAVQFPSALAVTPAHTAAMVEISPSQPFVSLADDLVLSTSPSNPAQQYGSVLLRSESLPSQNEHQSAFDSKLWLGGDYEDSEWESAPPSPSSSSSDEDGSDGESDESDEDADKRDEEETVHEHGQGDTRIQEDIKAKAHEPASRAIEYHHQQSNENMQLVLQTSMLSNALHGGNASQSDGYWNGQLAVLCAYTQRRVALGHVLSPSVTPLWQAIDAVRYYEQQRLASASDASDSTEVKEQALALRQFRNNFVSSLPRRSKAGAKMDPITLPDHIMQILTSVASVVQPSLLPHIIREKMLLRNVYTALDDQLLTVGLNYFGMHLDTIRTYCLPTKTTYSLSNRYNNRKRRLTPTNSVKTYHLSLVKPLTVFESWKLVQAMHEHHLNFSLISERYLTTRTGAQLRLAFGEMVTRGLSSTGAPVLSQQPLGDGDLEPRGVKRKHDDNDDDDNHEDDALALLKSVLTADDLAEITDAQQALTVDATRSPGSATFPDFATLGQAWAYVNTNPQSSPFVITLTAGQTHVFPSSQFAMTSAVSVAHVVSDSTQTAYLGPAQATFTTSMFQLQGTAQASFTGITFQGFTNTDRSTTSTWAVLEADQNTQLQLINCTIRDGSAASATFAVVGRNAATINFNVTTILSDTANRFEAYVTDSATLTVDGSLFQAQASWRDSLIRSFVNSTVYARTSTFQSNHGTQTGVFNFLNSQPSSIANSTLTGNSGSSIMVLRVAGTSVVSLAGTTISQHIGTPRIMQVSDSARLTLANCLINGNQQGWLVGSYITSSLSMYGTIIRDNSFTANNPIYIGQNLRSSIFRCQFLNNTASSPFILADRNSSLAITHSTFVGNTMSTSGLIQSYSSSLMLSNVSLANNRVATQAVTDRLISFIGALPGAQFQLTHGSFVNNTLGLGSVLAFMNVLATYSVANSVFDGNQGVSLQSADGAALSVTDSQFSRLTSSASQSPLVVGGPTFIGNSQFTACTGATNGGALQYLPVTQNSSLTITGCSFSNNAASGDGGALYFNPISPNQVSLSSSSFTANNASRGGAVYTANAFAPVPRGNNTFTQNTAGTQGADMASQASSLAFANNPLWLGGTNWYNGGDYFPRLVVAAYDQYGNVVHTHAAETFLLGVTLVPANPLAVATVVGEISKAILGGTATFNSLRVLGTPGSYTLLISSLTEMFPSTTYNISVPVGIRSCNSPNIQQMVDGYQACVAPVCSNGCIAGQGTCMGNDLCVCMSGWEGDDCSAPAGYYDAVSIRWLAPSVSFSIAPAFSYEISSLLQARSTALGLGDVTLRNITQTNSTAGTLHRRTVGGNTPMIIAQVLLSSNGTYLEGSQLTRASTLLQQSLSSQPIVSSVAGAQLTVVDAALVTGQMMVLWMSSAPVIVVLALAAAGVCTTVVVIATFFKFRDTAVVKSSSFLFSTLICTGLLFGYAVIPLSAGVPTQTTCNLQIWLPALSFGMVVGNLLTKTLRIYFIFNRKGRVGGLSDRAMIRYTLGILTCELLILVPWAVVSPPAPVIVNLPAYRYWSCSSPNQTMFNGVLIAYNFLLLALSCYLALQTRHAQSAYRESKAIGLSVYVIIIVSAVVLPVTFVQSTGPIINFYLKSAAFVMINLTVKWALFGRKVHIALFRPEMNNMEALNQRSVTSFSTTKSASQRVSETVMMKQVAVSRRGSKLSDASAVGTVSPTKGLSPNTSPFRRGSEANVRRGSLSGSGGAMYGSDDAVVMSGRRGSEPLSPTSLDTIGASKDALLANKSSRGLVAGSSASVASSKTSSSTGDVAHSADELLKGSKGTRTRRGSNDALKGSINELKSNKHVIPEDSVPEEYDDPNEPTKELLHVCVRGGFREVFHKTWVHLFPGTRHLVFSETPVPSNAQLIHLAHCRVRNLSHSIKNCFEIQVGSQMYMIRTKSDVNFNAWYSRIAAQCFQEETAIPQTEFEDFELDDADQDKPDRKHNAGGSNSSSGSPTVQKTVATSK
ncbi:hypothetical protein RI367_000334 [Sorochytrium milnesiophthora]